MLTRILLLAIAASTSTAFAEDPFLGTWKLNTAKSKFSPGPAPQSHTTNYTLEDGFVVVTANRVDAKGQQVTYTNRYKRDGQEHPYSTPALKGVIAVKLVNERTTEGVIKATDGPARMTSKNVISKDGKTRTFTVTGTDSQGRKVHDVMFYEKQ